MHSTLLWFVVNQLAGAEAAEVKGLDLYSVCCVVGYCMVPQVVFSAVSLLIPKWVYVSHLSIECRSHALSSLCAMSWECAAQIGCLRVPCQSLQRSIVVWDCGAMHALERAHRVKDLCSADAVTRGNAGTHLVPLHVALQCIHDAMSVLDCTQSMPGKMYKVCIQVCSSQFSSSQ